MKGILSSYFVIFPGVCILYLLLTAKQNFKLSPDLWSCAIIKLSIAARIKYKDQEGYYKIMFNIYQIIL